MGHDAKDMIISELEFELGLTRARLAKSQCLNFVLEKHSHFLERKLYFHVRTIKKLRSSHFGLEIRRAANGQTEAVTEEIVDIVEGVNKLPSLHKVAEARLVAPQCPQLSTKWMKTVIDEAVTIQEEVLENSQGDNNLQPLSEYEVNEEAIPPLQCPKLLTEGFLNGSEIDPESPLAVASTQVSTVRSQMVNTSQPTNNVQAASSSKAISIIDKPFKCGVDGCGKSFTRLSNLVAHKRQHLGIKKYVCRLEGCVARFMSHQERIRHERAHDNKTFLCTIGHCSLRFLTEALLLEHQASFHLILDCPHCDESFANRLHRDRHVQQKHNDVQVRSHGPIASTSMENNRRSLQLVTEQIASGSITAKSIEHSALPLRTALDNGQRFDISKLSSLKDREIPRAKSVFRQFTCPQCSYSTSEKKKLERHKSVHSTASKSFKCELEQCPMVFATKNQLELHLKSRHAEHLTSLYKTLLEKF